MLMIPRFDEENVESWMQSVDLVAVGLKLTALFEKDVQLTDQGDETVQAAGCAITNAMLNSMPDRVRRITSGAGAREDLTPFRIMNRIVKHYLPVTATNEVQLCVKLYWMKWTPGKPIDAHANEIRAIASRINKIQLMIKPDPPNPSYIGKKDMVAILIISLNMCSQSCMRGCQAISFKSLKEVAKESRNKSL